jgi:bifunctional non-homologous end joining protein LigD
LEHGELRFTLHGRKLQGGFALVRARLKSASRGRESWLLIKRRDEHADPSWNIDRYDWSVLSGRSLQEIAAGVSPRRIRATATASRDPHRRD